MKYKISYLPCESEEAAADVAILQQLHPSAKVRKSDAHPPFKHIYITTRKPVKAAESENKDCDIPGNMV